MSYEVECKYRGADVARIERWLRERSIALGPATLQADTYYVHPARDFAATDEALRIRRTHSAAVLTYKGPKVDQSTKTRRELEVPLGSEAQAATMASLLVALGFRPLAEVCKQRRTAHVQWHDREVELALDTIERLGGFVELETRSADEAGLDAARACIAELAAELGLDQSERRSYLELLLATTM
ncbi:MAG TPA: class IV adenylate cyclase [Pirellulales bacterium]|nr:class IV adenylate cyclase [Pirellulales bacterium]